MRHATAQTLHTIEPLLAKLRTLPLKERKLRVFYRGSTAFLHFHEDPLGVFAHVKTPRGWKRMPVNARQDVRRFLGEVDAMIGERR